MDTIAARFSEKYDVLLHSGCWLWKAAKDTAGYGRFKWRGRIDGAHRASWEMAHGPIRRGLDVLHLCNVKLCVNPSHLYLGTQKDNMRDAIRDGLWVCPDRSGERNAAAKITRKIAEEIREAYSAGGISQDQIGRRYGVTQATVSKIVLGRTWANELR